MPDLITPSQIDSIQAIRLQPGDVLVLRCPKPLRSEMRARLLEQLTPRLPDGVEAMVLDGGIDIEVVRRAHIAGYQPIGRPGAPVVPPPRNP